MNLPQEGPLDDCGVSALIWVMEAGEHNKATMNMYVRVFHENMIFQKKRISTSHNASVRALV